MRTFKQRTKGLLHCLLALAALLAWMPGGARALEANRTVNASDMRPLVQYASSIQMQSPGEYRSAYTAQVNADGRTYTGYMISASDPRTDGTSTFTSTTVDAGYTRWLLYHSMPFQSADYVRSLSGISDLTETEIYVATFIRLMEIQTGAREYNPASVTNPMGPCDINRSNRLLFYFREHNATDLSTSTVATLTLTYKGDGTLVGDTYYGPYEVGGNVAATEPITLSVDRGGYSFVDINRANAITSVRVGQSFYVKVPATSNGEAIRVTASTHAWGFDDAAFLSNTGNARMVGLSSSGDTVVQGVANNTWQRSSAANQLLRLSYTYNNAYVANGIFELYSGKTPGRNRPAGAPLATLTTTSSGYVQTNYVLTPGADYTIYQASPPPSGYTYSDNVVFTAANNADRINAFTIVAAPVGAVGQESKLTVEVVNASGQKLNGSVFEVFEGSYAQDMNRPGGGLVNPVARFTIASNGTYTSIGNELTSTYRYTIGKTYTIHELTTAAGYEREKNVLWTPTQSEYTITYKKGTTSTTKDFEIKKYVTHVNGVSTGQTGNESTFTEYSVKRGDRVTYGIRLENRSDLTLRAARIIDEIPSGMSFYESDNVGLGWYRSGNALYFDSAASLAKGMQITYALTLRVNDNAPLNVRQINCVKIDDLRCEKNYCIVPSKMSASIGVCVTDGSSTGQYGYDLALQKWVMKVNGAATGQNGTELNPSAIAVKRGDKVTYGIRIINQGSYTTIPTRIADSLPYGTSFATSDNTNGAWYMSNGKLYLDPSGIKLRAGEQIVYELTLRVTDNAALGSITNAARIVSMANESGQLVDDEDSYLGDDFSQTRVVKDNVITENGRLGYDDDSYDIAVICVTDGTSGTGNGDIRVSKFVHSVSGTTTGLNGSESTPTVYTVVKNSTVRWGIRIYNAGTSSAKLTQIIDTLPTGLAFLNGNAENNGWNAYGNAYAFTPNVVLEPGQYTTVYMTTKVLSAVGVQLTNNVEVQWDGKSSSAYASINVKNFEEMDKTGDELSTLIPVFIGGVLLLGGSATLLVTRRRKFRGKK